MMWYYLNVQFQGQRVKLLQQMLKFFDIMYKNYATGVTSLFDVRELA